MGIVTDNTTTSGGNSGLYTIIGTVCIICCGLLLGLCGCIDSMLCRRNEIFSIGAIISATTYTVDIVSGTWYN